ncbi:MAG TPA: cobalamin-independent methionine synthase II family protein [Gemmatimonadaceae bacterium]|nr:cobalamin-independent methionine synthase II family protein [Gemmatimonadaceae bacterium]
MSESPVVIPTEPIGSIPRPLELIDAVRAHVAGEISTPELDVLYRDATIDTLRRFEETGSPVISDGEQRKYQNFATYAVHGLENMAPDGFRLQFVGHYRQWPRLVNGPFRYKRYADDFLGEALQHTTRPVKQAVIAPSALSLMYPEQDIPEYSRDEFLRSVLAEHEREIRACLALGAHTVQVDFTEGRLAVKLDPSGALLNSFITLNNLALDRFTDAERTRIGIHTCPGGDLDSTHSADVDYAELLPSLFELRAGNFFIALARESERERVLALIGRYLKPYQRAFVGVIDVLNPRVETVDEVCDAVMLAAEYIPVAQLGTTDDCGYSPFSDDTSTSRDLAFEKIRARVVGTAKASRLLSSKRTR